MCAPNSTTTGADVPVADEVAEAHVAPLFNADGSVKLELFEQDLERVIARMVRLRDSVHSHTCTDREGVEFAICREVMRMLDPHRD